ncbi:MAG: hypothetical protein GXP31_01135 [Kiritimatiellaeota bacterium]|nr:hypothetical protein [Kiritimatiellota bacterium]
MGREHPSREKSPPAGNRADALNVTFWGTRGTVVPFVPSAEFGVHTTALEVWRDGSRPLFVDLGTGAIPAAEAALQRGVRDFDIWLTHLHSDHISGMFSYAPIYRSDCRVRILSAAPDVEAALTKWFSPPYHPVALQDVGAALEFVPMPPQGRYELPEQGLTVFWGGMPHPQPCSGLRFDTGANAFVFGTDVEIAADGRGGALQGLLHDPFSAGLTAIDGFFADSEIHKYPDWGHSSWRQAWDLCVHNQVCQLLMTHHHPAQSDAALRDMEAVARAACKCRVHWARERDTWRLEGNHARKA